MNTCVTCVVAGSGEPVVRMMSARLPTSVVWGLLPGSSAEKQGLKDGDVVVEIQGKPASELYGTTSWDKLLEGDQFGIRIPARRHDRNARYHRQCMGAGAVESACFQSANDLARKPPLSKKRRGRYPSPQAK